MLVFQTNPLGVEVFSYVNAFFFVPIYLHLFWPIEGKRSIARFHSRVQRLCKFFGTKEIFYTRKNVQLLRVWFGIPDVTSRENALYRSRGTCCVRGIFNAGNFKFSPLIGCLMAGIRNARKTPPLVLIVAHLKC